MLRSLAFCRGRCTSQALFEGLANSKVRSLDSWISKDSSIVRNLLSDGKVEMGAAQFRDFP